MQRLFNNQIQPQAQPISSFINPEQFRRANPGQPTLLGDVSRIASLQQAGTSSVAGFNEFDQTAKALAPFSKQLTSLANQGFKYYAKSNIEAGYYEEMQNETQRAKLQFQRNQEAGAAEAAQMQTQLGKTDPIAGSLLREANPWKAIGRRRALAQMAAGRISTVLNGDLSLNAGLLAGIRPGSPELGLRKQALTQEVLSRYQLTGDEAEAAYYVTPVMNKAWDQYTKKQSELYTDELYQSTIETTNASVNSSLQMLVMDGITMPDGTVLKPGMAGFGVAAGAVLTRQIDQGLALVGGEDRVKAMKKIKESLGAVYGMGIPGIRDAIGNIRLGDRNTEMSKRPKWIDANPFELMDYTNKGMQAAKTRDGLMQNELERELQNRLLEVQGMTFDDPRYQETIGEIRAWANSSGIRNADDIITSALAENEQANIEQYSASPESDFAWEQAMQELTPSDVSPENIDATIDEVENRAQNVVGREARRRFIDKNMKRIKEARERFAKLPTGVALQGNLSRIVREDLAAKDIAALKGKSQLSWLPDGGIQVVGQVDEKSQRYAQFARNVRGLYEREFSNQVEQWRNDNPGMDQVPSGILPNLWDKAAETVRKSEKYKAFREAAINAPPATGTDGTPRNQPVDPEKQPVPRDSATSIPTERARKYTSEPIMNQYWLRSEMQNLQSGRPVSKQLYDLANSVGTSTDRYLLEQIKFFGPQLDPQGVFRGILEKRIERTRQSTTPAASNFAPATDPMGNQSYNGRSPGAWLMSMFTPPAAAATLPPPSVAPQPAAANGTWTTSSGFEIRQYVTGDVTAPHNGGSVIVDTAGHGGDAYHNHYEFATVEQRKRATRLFRSLGFRVTSEVRSGDPGAHGAGLGLDVAPPLDLPRTPAAEAEWSRRANAVLGFNP